MLNHLGEFYIISVPVAIEELVLGIVVTNGAKIPLYGYIQTVHTLSCERLWLLLQKHNSNMKE